MRRRGEQRAPRAELRGDDQRRGDRHQRRRQQPVVARASRGNARDVAQLVRTPPRRRAAPARRARVRSITGSIAAQCGRGGSPRARARRSRARPRRSWRRGPSPWAASTPTRRAPGLSSCVTRMRSTPGCGSTLLERPSAAKLPDVVAGSRPACCADEAQRAGSRAGCAARAGASRGRRPRPRCPGSLCVSVAALVHQRVEPARGGVHREVLAAADAPRAPRGRRRRTATRARRSEAPRPTRRPAWTMPSNETKSHSLPRRTAFSVSGSFCGSKKRRALGPCWSLPGVVDRHQQRPAVGAQHEEAARAGGVDEAAAGRRHLGDEAPRLARRRSRATSSASG